LSKIRGRWTIFRTSLYADDASISVAPNKEDIQNLSSILKASREVTRLEKNFKKLLVMPIRCRNIDIDEVLSDMLVILSTFNLKYSGLPLSV
jgi:hypothetical protein